MLTPTTQTYNGNSPPFLIKIINRAKNVMIDRHFVIICLFQNLITLPTDVSKNCNLSECCLHSFKHSKRYNSAKTKTCHLPEYGFFKTLTGFQTQKYQFLCLKPCNPIDSVFRLALSNMALHHATFCGCHVALHECYVALHYRHVAIFNIQKTPCPFDLLSPGNPASRL